MNNAKLLAVGGDTEWLQTVIKLVNDHEGWTATAAKEEEEAIEKFCQYPFDIVLLDEGIPEAEHKKLLKILSNLNPDILIRQHCASEKGLLSATIRDAIRQWETNNKPAVYFTDNPLQNARFNISIQ
jgi:CheY-like chemotaxis protein